MAYLLDTNVLIEAVNRYYGFDLCPGFWEWLDSAASVGQVISLRNVLDELLARDDELTKWAKSRPTLFPLLRPEAAEHLKRLSLWAKDGYYTQGAVATFLNGADYFLVASAMSNGDIVVTHERPDRRPGRITIPDACIAMKLHFMTSFTMLRREGVKLVLGAA